MRDLVQLNGWMKGKISNVKRTAKTLVYGTTDYNPAVRQILSEYGDEIVVGISVNRSLVPSILTKTLDIASFGVFSKKMEEEELPNLYHLSLVFTLESGVKILLEKNITINAVVITTEREETVDSLPIAIFGRRRYTLGEYLQNGLNSMGVEKFFRYSTSKNNCQDFVLAILSANRLNNGKIEAFVKQNTKPLFEGNERLQGFSDSITDLVAKANTLIHGGDISYRRNYINPRRIRISRNGNLRLRK